MLLETVSLDDRIGYLFIVNIEFDLENADAKQLMYNDVYHPVINKQENLDANERSIFQLRELYLETTEGETKSYRKTKKLEAILISKKFIPLYLEHRKFLILRHFTFEQSRFKKYFIIMM